MGENRVFDTVELPAICEAFAAFPTHNLGELYVIRDSIAAYVAGRFDYGVSNDSLPLLEAILRATYGIAISHELPVADTMAYAVFWREKTAAIERTMSLPHPSGMSEAASATRGLRFSLHRYSTERLVDSIALALILPSYSHLAPESVSLPEKVPRDTLERRLARYRKGGQLASILGLPLAAPASIEEVPPAWASQTEATGPSRASSEWRETHKSLRDKFVAGRGKRRSFIKLEGSEISMLRGAPLFSTNPELIIHENCVDVFRFLARFRQSPEPLQTGVAADLYDVYAKAL
jgi:hypothetical protein